MSKHTPVKIYLNRAIRTLTVWFDDGQKFDMTCEYLRIHSPSAEVQGHKPGQEVLQIGKENVNINTIESIGNYAIKPCFDDGHDSGIFSWDTLYMLGKYKKINWKRYLDRIEESGYLRNANV